MATVNAPRPVAKFRAEPNRPASPEPKYHPLFVELTDATNQKIADLTQRTGYEAGELIDIAMTLLQLSVQAVDEGKLVGVVAPDQDLELEFTGFYKDDPTSTEASEGQPAGLVG